MSLPINDRLAKVLGDVINHCQGPTLFLPMHIFKAMQRFVPDLWQLVSTCQCVGFNVQSRDITQELYTSDYSFLTDRQLKVFHKEEVYPKTTTSLRLMRDTFKFWYRGAIIFVIQIEDIDDQKVNNKSVTFYKGNYTDWCYTLQFTGY
jgi:hypothetical protein